MISLQNRAVETAVKNLAAVGALYSVKFGDQVFSNMPEAPERKRRVKPAGQPPNFYLNQFLPIIEKMQPGEFAEVPAAPDMDVGRLRSCISAWCATHWGPGTFSTQSRPDLGVVHVLRTAE